MIKQWTFWPLSAFWAMNPAEDLLLFFVLLALKPLFKLIQEARSFECSAPGGLMVLYYCFAEVIDLLGNGAFIDFGLGARYEFVNFARS